MEVADLYPPGGRAQGTYVGEIGDDLLGGTVTLATWVAAVGLNLAVGDLGVYVCLLYHIHVWY